MSKELNNITDVVMSRIHQSKIKMRPRVYFAIGSLLAFAGLVASMLTSVFLIGLLRFSLRSHGPMGEYRFEQLLSSFSWGTPVFAILGLMLGIWLLRRYDFSYKIDFKVIVIAVVLAIITAGWLIDMTGLNDTLLRRGPMQGFMRRYLEEGTSQFRQEPGRNRNNL